ncbi:hypothetical protein BH18ACI1_BH18ACI1_05140 [soil metagenome]
MACYSLSSAFNSSFIGSMVSEMSRTPFCISIIRNFVPYLKLVTLQKSFGKVNLPFSLVNISDEFITFNLRIYFNAKTYKRIIFVAANHAALKIRFNRKAEILVSKEDFF